MPKEKNTRFTAAMTFNADKERIQTLRNTHDLGEKEMMHVLLNVVEHSKDEVAAAVVAYNAQVAAEAEAAKAALKAAKEQAKAEKKAQREQAKAEKAQQKADAKAAKAAERERVKAEKAAAKAAKEAEAAQAAAWCSKQLTKLALGQPRAFFLCIQEEPNRCTQVQACLQALSSTC